MDATIPPSEFFRFRPPYRTLDLVEGYSREPAADVSRGELLLWRLHGPLTGPDFETARARPAGVSLAVILPAAGSVSNPAELLRIVEMCRPQSVFPHHVRPDLLDLQAALRRPPDDLPGEVLDYLVWRGLVIDHDTRHLLRRTIELAGQLKTVSGLCRSLYVSRRALGRRFLERGIPVPSHWLHFSRIVRACSKLQGDHTNLFDIASELGYADGFALSNQMRRLVGVRPSVARSNLGWEWILESWLHREAATGGLAPEYSALFLRKRFGSATPMTGLPEGADSRADAARRTEVAPARSVRLNQAPAS